MNRDLFQLFWDRVYPGENGSKISQGRRDLNDIFVLPDYGSHSFARQMGHGEYQTRKILAPSQSFGKDKNSNRRVGVDQRPKVVAVVSRPWSVVGGMDSVLFFIFLDRICRILWICFGFPVSG